MVVYEYIVMEPAFVLDNLCKIGYKKSDDKTLIEYETEPLAICSKHFASEYDNAFHRL